MSQRDVQLISHSLSANKEKGSQKCCKGRVTHKRLSPHGENNERETRLRSVLYVRGRSAACWCLRYVLGKFSLITP